MESGTIEQQLPGLGTSGPEVAVQTLVGRAGGISPRKRLVVVSGSSHPEPGKRLLNGPAFHRDPP